MSVDENPSNRSARRNVDVSIETASGSGQSIGVQSLNDDEILENDLPNHNVPLASGDKLMYENRINGLVQSNMAKISRIQTIQIERDQLAEQVSTLNRINRSLAQTVDMYQNNGNNENHDNNILQQQLANAQAECGALRGRIGHANREIFDLKQENERMKSILATHSKKVLGEHNYNLD